MVTFVDLVRGAKKVLPTSVPPRLAEVKGDIRIDTIKINNMTGVKTVVINTSMRPSGLYQTKENYPATVIFEGIEDPVYNPPSLTKDNVRVRCACFTGDTLVVLANGDSVPIKDLVGKEYFYLYSYDIKNRKTVVGKGHSARLTKKDADIVEVTLDNGNKIRCTPDHKFLMKNGEYKEVKDIEPSESLMAAYRKRFKGDFLCEGYKMICSPGMAFRMEHYLADDYNLENDFYKLEQGNIRHHIDFNKDNNSPENINRVTHEEHNYIHKDLTSARMKVDNPMFNQETVDKVIKTNRESGKSKRISEAMSKAQAELAKEGKAHWQTKEWKEEKARIMKKTMKHLVETGNHHSINKAKENKHHWQTEKHSANMRKLRLEEASKGTNPLQVYNNSLTKEEKIKNTERLREPIKKLLREGKHPFQREKSEEHIKKLKERAYNNSKDPIIREKMARTRIFNTLMKKGLIPEDINKIDNEFFEKYKLGRRYNDAEDFKEKVIELNHKIISIEYVGKEDVYDLTVDKYHNFLIDVECGQDCSSGVFVHNCKAFYFYCIYANKKAGALAGGRFKRYVRKTPVTDPRFPPKNPQNIPCLCKHLFLLMEYLKYRRIADA